MEEQVVLWRCGACKSGNVAYYTWANLFGERLYVVGCSDCGRRSDPKSGNDYQGIVNEARSLMYKAPGNDFFLTRVLTV